MHKESFDFQEKKHNKILMPERIHLFKEKNENCIQINRILGLDLRDQL